MRTGFGLFLHKITYSLTLAYDFISEGISQVFSQVGYTLDTSLHLVTHYFGGWKYLLGIAIVHLQEIFWFLLYITSLFILFLAVILYLLALLKQLLKQHGWQGVCITKMYFQKLVCLMKKKAATCVLIIWRLVSTVICMIQSITWRAVNWIRNTSSITVSSSPNWVRPTIYRKEVVHYSSTFDNRTPLKSK